MTVSEADKLVKKLKSEVCGLKGIVKDLRLKYKTSEDNVKSLKNDVIKLKEECRSYGRKLFNSERSRLMTEYNYVFSQKKIKKLEDYLMKLKDLKNEDKSAVDLPYGKTPQDDNKEVGTSCGSLLPPDDELTGFWSDKGQDILESTLRTGDAGRESRLSAQFYSCVDIMTCLPIYNINECMDALVKWPLNHHSATDAKLDTLINKTCSLQQQMSMVKADRSKVITSPDNIQSFASDIAQNREEIILLKSENIVGDSLSDGIEIHESRYGEKRLSEETAYNQIKEIEKLSLQIQELREKSAQSLEEIEFKKYLIKEKEETLSNVRSEIGKIRDIIKLQMQESAV